MKKLLIFLVLSCFSFSAKAQSQIDFLSAKATLQFDFEKQSVFGSVSYKIKVLKPMDTLKIDAKSMQFSDVLLNKKVAVFQSSKKALLLPGTFKPGTYHLQFNYSATPRQALYFTNINNQQQIFSQGQGKYTSHWFPSPDDQRDKLTFDVSFICESGKTVISNGALKSKTNVAGKTQWNYGFKKPISAYLFAVAVGDFAKIDVPAINKTKRELYVKSSETHLAESTYQHHSEIFTFLERKIGLPYPWEIYRQVPLEDFLYAGMENNTCTFFAQDYVTDAVGAHDKPYANVHAHELAHHWFGNLVTAENPEDHWLYEAFATYYALLAERELFGDTYFSFALLESARDIAAFHKKKPEAVVSTGASSLTYYQKGAWCLFYLNRLLGDETFDKIVNAYLKTYAYKTATTANFLDLVKKNSKIDVLNFEKNWLRNPNFDTAEALNTLKKFSPDIRQYLETSAIVNGKDISTEALRNVYKSSNISEIRREVLLQADKLNETDRYELIKLGIVDIDWENRQLALALTDSIAKGDCALFAKTLADSSYVTREIALKKLYLYCPEQRMAYLDALKDQNGLHDYNVRIFWLTLALKSKSGSSEMQLKYYDELLRYAGEDQPTERRQNAFTALFFLDASDKATLRLLPTGLSNHRWQFVKFCRDKIRELLQQEKYRLFFESELPNYSPRVSAELKRLLEEKKTN
ncbi:M1 family metallopeptidase [Flavobacterium sp.]|uniref:M1 family metallopeptidase n=1 Tax=Flavobacterium sp. TaxID=239 RepID=UPI00260545BD|nr:M1 family metallopeptidase [Flavobacterium sp.]